MIEISVVIPVYNSGENLVVLSNQICQALEDIKYELILVNDNSTDHSWLNIQKQAKKNPQVLGLNLRKNCGQDNAIMAGLHYANGNYVVIMDDDLQHSPLDIMKLYSSCKINKADICFANFEKKKQAIWKNFGSWLNGKVSEWFLNKPKSIYLSPFKIVIKDVINEIIKYDGPYPYIDGLLLSVTGSMIQIDIDHHKRFHGKSNFSILKSISVFSKHITTFSVVPLRFASITGLCFSICGFLMVPFYLYEHFFTSNVVPGWTTLAILNSLIGGLVLFSLGIIGEYLGRTYLKINRKPQYTIKELTKDE